MINRVPTDRPCKYRASTAVQDVPNALTLQRHGALQTHVKSCRLWAWKPIRTCRGKRQHFNAISRNPTPGDGLAGRLLQPAHMPEQCRESLACDGPSINQSIYFFSSLCLSLSLSLSLEPSLFLLSSRAQQFMCVVFVRRVSE